jgi:uncharacterized protein YjdB
VAKPTVKNYTYDGTSKTGMASGTGYTLSGTVTAKNAGSYKVTATLKTGYAWKDGTTAPLTLTWKISPASITKATVAAIADQTATGKAITPKMQIKLGGKTLTQGTDYTVTYKNNVKVGTATATAKGKGNYTGSVSKSFKIVSAAASVTYRNNVESKGWMPWVKDGERAGSWGEGLRLEALQVKLAKKPYSGSVQYRAHVQNKGWINWVSDGGTAGVANGGLRMEAVQIKLTGEMAKHFDIYYRLHVERTGWMGWAKNGAQAGTAGFGYRVEAMQVKIVPKGAPAPGPTDNCFKKKA